MSRGWWVGRWGCRKEEGTSQQPPGHLPSGAPKWLSSSHCLTLLWAQVNSQPRVLLSPGQEGEEVGSFLHPRNPGCVAEGGEYSKDRRGLNRARVRDQLGAGDTQAQLPWPGLSSCCQRNLGLFQPRILVSCEKQIITRSLDRKSVT